jgi:hypothetical protein
MDAQPIINWLVGKIAQAQARMAQLESIHVREDDPNYRRLQGQEEAFAATLRIVQQNTRALVKTD